MTAFSILAAVLAVGAVVLLFVALLKPEKF